MLVYVAFVAGFFLLIKGADLLVEGASSLARRMRVSDLAIGLTIVSFGTSAPELVVNLLASLDGNSGLALGNVIGSNIANILLVLGFSALIAPLVVTSSTVWKEIPFSLLAALVLAIMANDSLLICQHIGDGAGGALSLLSSSEALPTTVPEADWISRGDGLVLLAFFTLFLYYTFGMKSEASVATVADMPLWKALLWILLGLIGLGVGGEWIVAGAIALSQLFGLSPTLVGIFVVGVGTSLPELAASGMAVARGNTGIAIGNAVGSNIFNIFWVLGLSAAIHPIAYDSLNNADLLVVLIGSLALFIAIFLGRRYQLYRWEGSAFLLLYAAYLFIRLPIFR